MGGARPEQPVVGDAIPAELTRRRQWVCWRWEQRPDGKWTKPPYNARTGGHARANDPDTWAAFAEVQAARGQYDGIGYVLADGDPYVGIDLDNCRDPAAGTLAPWAAQIVARFQSYSEVSPSGTGLRILIEGQLPPGGRKHDDIEVYATGRYLTITGAHLPGTPATIQPRQDTLDHFHLEYFPPPPPPPGQRPAPGPDFFPLDDADLLDRAQRASNGALFARLWRGETLGDHSKADLMLCGMLAFWTGRDPAQIDRLFRRSGLIRPKWDERHAADGRTYGQMTVARAIADCRTVYEPPDARRAPSAEPITGAEPWRAPLTLREFFADPPATTPSWLIEGVLQAATNGWLAAGAKSGKSYLALDLLLACATGQPWLGHFPVPRPLRVVLIEEEDPAWRVHQRLGRLLRGCQLAPDQCPPDFWVSFRAGYRLDDPPALAPLITWFTTIRPDLIVWDVFNRLHVQDERRPDQIMPVLRQLDRLRDLLGCTNLLLHHQRKPSPMGPDLAAGGVRLRGPSEFWAWAENSLYLTLIKGKSRSLALVIEPESKEGMLDPFRAHLEDLPDGGQRWVYDGVAQARGEKVADRLALIQKILAQGPMSGSAIRQALVPHLGGDTPQPRTIERDLRVLLEAGAVTREGSTKTSLWHLVGQEPQEERPPF
jgi:putative DNA primase/helicase